MARRGRPRGITPRWDDIEARLVERGADRLGPTIAALLYSYYPVPIRYSWVARDLSALTGLEIDRRTVYDWVRTARQRLEQMADHIAKGDENG